MYDRRDDFRFPIDNFPWLDSDVPRASYYGIYISQLVRFARVCSEVKDFHSRNMQLTEKTFTSSWRFFTEKNYKGDSFILEPGENLTVKKPNVKKRALIKSAMRVQREPVRTNDVLPISDKYEKHWPAVAAWFLGPKAENLEIFNTLAVKSFKANAEFRRNYFPTDHDYITNEMKEDPAYRNEIGQIEDELNVICKDLQKSIPITSIRMQGHMTWDTAMPANLGYLAALLYNANNVANEASPVTTSMEIEVGEQLCGMLGYDTLGTPKPWGHITAGGSIANIEAMWSSRNVKFYPFSVQKAIKENNQLRFARDYEVFNPRLNCTQKLLDMTKWDLLNINTDDVIKMTKAIQSLMQKNNIDPSSYSDLVNTTTLAKLGWYKFLSLFGLSEHGVICIPATNHYSWPKAASLLGMGSDGLKTVPCDEYARMDIIELRRILNELLQKKIPVISVVAVIGSTESSSVDALSEIVSIREEYRRKGLNFAINADAAWGGYFTSMLQGGPVTNRPGYEGYVPLLPLSKYTSKQLAALKFADTITIDPHKSGFIPYPAGALCYRNGGMKEFVQVTASIIDHVDADPSVGIYGVEGSKPGAAAVGALLAHRVIGLDQFGYGAILGQCQFGAKLMYCLWLTLAKDEDNFVCAPLQPLPPNMTLGEAKRFIRKHITGKSNTDIVQNEDLLRFLEEIGPDLVINAFTVNPKIKGKLNTDIKICEKVVNEIFLRLSSTHKRENIRRIPLIVTSSVLNVGSFGNAVQKFKQRVGLPGDTTEGLPFISNCVMNPWVSTKGQTNVVGSAFRQTVLDSIGVVTDEPHLHSFIALSLTGDDNTVFGEYIATFHIPCRQYQSIVKFQFVNDSIAAIFRQKQNIQRSRRLEQRKPIVLQTNVNDTLGSFLTKTLDYTSTVNCYIGLPTERNKPFLRDVEIKIADIPRFKHLDLTLTEHPEHMTYFLYGDDNGVHLSHTFTKYPDFIQVVNLVGKPKSIDDIFIEQGIDVIIPNMHGGPPMNGAIRDPLTKQAYHIEYMSFNGEEVVTKMEIDQEYGKVWFDSCEINGWSDYHF